MELILQFWPIIAFVLVQFVAFVWKFSTIETRVKHIENEISELKKVNERLASLEAKTDSIGKQMSPITAYILGRQ